MQLLPLFSPKVIKDLLILLLFQVLVIFLFVIAWKIVDPETIQLQKFILLFGLISPYLVFMTYDLYLIIFRGRTMFRGTAIPFGYMSLEKKPARIIEAVLLVLGGVLAVILIIWVSFG